MKYLNESFNDFVNKKINSSEDLNEAINIPSNITKFAKDRGVLADVKKVAKWANKNGKRIVGGTAIGKGYSTLVLDLTYQGSEIYFNMDTGIVKLNGIPFHDEKSFKDALNESFENFLNEKKTYKSFWEVIEVADKELSGFDGYEMNPIKTKNGFNYTDVDGETIEVIVKGKTASIVDGEQNMRIDDFVNLITGGDYQLLEARVQYKRKYTDRNPAKTMNTNTKVRTKVLAAMADGVITEEELKGILKELNANPRWYKRNSKLFRITEEGITLSKTGKRMSKHITPENDITEDLPISEAVINNNEDAIKYLIKNYKEITGNSYSSVNVDDKDIGKIERFLKKNKIKVDSFWDDWIDYDHANESVNEGAMSEIDIIAKESKNFKDFKSTILKTYKKLKDTKKLDKWLRDLYDDSKENDYYGV